MRRSLRLLLFGVVLPGALTHALYGALRDRNVERERHVLRFTAVEVPAAAPAHPLPRAAPVPPVPPRAPAPPTVVRLGGADDCTARRDLTLSLQATDLARLQVESGAGTLRISGEPGRSDVLVRAQACASDLRDSSGSRDIRVVDVAGPLVVAADGSGSLEHANIGGRVTVPSKHRRR